MNENIINSADLKNYVFEILRKNPKTQVLSILGSVEDDLKRRLSQEEERFVLEFIHELITSNILITALDRSNTGWPWLSLTIHGQEVLSNAGPPVYDYDGFLSALKRKIPQCDPVIVRYLSESLRAYQTNLFLSAMVMLGCASEKAILVLIDSYVLSIQSEVNREKLRSRINRRDISIAYEEFKKSFDSTKHQIKLSSPVNDFDAHVDAIFNFIRMVRNSIVHPENLPDITSALVYSNLQQASYYLVTIYALVEYYKQNKITV